ncbi:uncharacterized protein [Rutidosis leptorrhynchoides]|uniref:uncharacterized protein n=1 Tax=Rutidosis leptorrhynchoides TaxID=125765 RepID=UPI003A9917D8
MNGVGFRTFLLLFRQSCWNYWENLRIRGEAEFGGSCNGKVRCREVFNCELYYRGTSSCSQCIPDRRNMMKEMMRRGNSSPETDRPSDTEISCLINRLCIV